LACGNPGGLRPFLEASLNLVGSIRSAAADKFIASEFAAVFAKHTKPAKVAAQLAEAAKLMEEVPEQVVRILAECEPVVPSATAAFLDALCNKGGTLQASGQLLQLFCRLSPLDYKAKFQTTPLFLSCHKGSAADS
jgi:hypothetical protein